MLSDFRIREYTKDEARNLNPLQLALIGDGVYDIFIRSYILSKNSGLSPHKMHVIASSYVKAKSQANIIHELIKDLEEEEVYIYKRGRNSKSGTMPKNADVRDYRMATGFEALIGYLYLIGNKQRIEFIFNKAIEILE